MNLLIHNYSDILDFPFTERAVEIPMFVLVILVAAITHDHMQTRFEYDISQVIKAN